MPQDFDPATTSFEDMEVDFSQEFDDEAQITAPEYPSEGWYHVSVAEIDSTNPKAIGAAIFKFEIITGNVEKQEGKMINHAIFPPHPDAKNQKNAKKNWYKTIMQAMYAFGLREKDEFPKLHICSDFWKKFEGKQCMVKVTHKEKKVNTDAGGSYTQINAVVQARSDMLPLFHPDVASVQYDASAAEMQGYKKPEGQKEEEI